MSATMDRLAEANPNIGEHLRDWQIARTQNNEDAYDWNAFRAHELQIGAPDPATMSRRNFASTTGRSTRPAAKAMRRPARAPEHKRGRGTPKRPRRLG
jgi:hypothetical protein